MALFRATTTQEIEPDSAQVKDSLGHKPECASTLYYLVVVQLVHVKGTVDILHAGSLRLGEGCNIEF